MPELVRRDPLGQRHLAGSAELPEIIQPMPTLTVTRPAGYAFHVGDGYEFEHDGQLFNGVVRGIAPSDERHLDITLEMSTGEYRRTLAALNG